MKRLLLLTLLLSLPFLVYSQYSPFLEEDKHWIYYEYVGQDYPYIAAAFILNVQGDTIIQGTSYKKLVRNNLAVYQSCPYPPCYLPYIPYQVDSKSVYAFLREDTQAQQVYRYLPPSGNSCSDDYLLYDFSSTQGDTLNACLRNGIGNTALPGVGLVDSIGNKNIYQQQREIIYTTGWFTPIGLPALGRMELAEGIGFLNHSFFRGQNNVLQDVCYGDYTACNIVSSSKEILEQQMFAIYPNPTSNSITIDTNLPIEETTVYDQMGRSLLITTATSIDVSHLAPGVYPLSIRWKNGKRVVRKIIVL